MIPAMTVKPAMSHRPAARLLSACAALVALSGCAVGPDFKRPAAPSASDYGSASVPEGTVSAEPSGAANGATEVIGGNAQRFVAGMDIPGQWWMVYQSPPLTRLVEQALKANPNIAAAEAALRQAHELYSAQWTSYFPLVQGNFNAARSEFPSSTLTSPTVASSTTYSLYTAQLSLSYAPDVFGLTRRTLEVARAQVESSRFQLRAVELTLSSNVVVTAMQEASLRAQIAVTERLLELQQQLTDSVRGQRALGTASDLDLLAQQSAQAQTAQTLPPLQKALGQTRDALTALLGRLPSEEPQETFRLEELQLPAELPVSVPSRLVEQRPDVRQAQENLHAASAAVGVALADMLPQFSIDAGLGSSALKLRDLFTPYTGFWTIGASLTQTLFDAGELLHRRRAADAALDQAAAQYRAAVILACQNVADTLRALQADADALQASVAAHRAARMTLELARRQNQLGTISQVAVLNAGQSYQQAELAMVQAQANRYADTAALFQSLGGGWWNRPQAIR
jgi:NodT family efflux transporter outer membrane factor (OMF) lipoprotein